LDKLDQTVGFLGGSYKVKTVCYSKKSKGEITRDKILAEATRLINQKGFEATSINDLVKATGLKKGCLYFHFPGKDELMMTILDKAKTDMLETIKSGLNGKTPAERLNNFFKGVLEYQRSCGFAGGCIFGNTALEMSDKDERMTFFVKDFFDKWIELIRKVVKEAQDHGEARNDIPAVVMAKHIVMTIEGGIMLTRLEKSEKPLKDCMDSLRTLIGLKK